MVLFWLLCFQPKTWTLESLIEEALHNNGGVIRHSLDAEAATLLAGSHAYLPDPDVQLGLYLVPVETRVGPQRASLGLSQAMPRPGERKAKVHAGMGMARIHQARGEDAATRLRRDITRTWYDLYFAQKKKSIEKESLHLMRQMESVARARFRTGKSSFAFVIQAQTSLAELTEQVSGTEDDIQAMVERLGGMVGLNHRPRIEKIVLPDEPPAPSPNTQPMLTTLAASRELLLREADLAAFALKPQWKFGLNYILTDPAVSTGVPGSGKDPLVATVAVKVPLNKKRVHAQVAGKKAASRSVSLQYEQLRRELNARTRAHQTLLRKNKRRVSLYEDTMIPHARAALDATLKAFRTGELEFTSVIGAQQTLLRLQLELERARADLYIHGNELAWLGTNHPLEEETP